MHTESTNVKDKRIVRGESTRNELIQAAKSLFGEQGYAETSTDEIVLRAGVTKGALYHHFAGKEELFRAVYEEVEREVSDQACVEFLAPDSGDSLVKGCGLWVDAHLDPSVRRIVMQDARAVLGWDDVRAIESRFGAVALRGALRKAMHAGVVDRQPLRPLSVMLMGALGEGAHYIADAEDPISARAEVGSLITQLLSAFQSPDPVAGDR